MALSRKHFGELADILGKSIKESDNNEKIEGIMLVKERLIKYLADENDRFDVSKFNDRVASNLLD